MGFAGLMKHVKSKAGDLTLMAQDGGSSLDEWLPFPPSGQWPAASVSVRVALLSLSQFSYCNYAGK
jgi:hypothetical protein